MAATTYDMKPLKFEKNASWICVPDQLRNQNLLSGFETAYFKKEIKIQQKITFPVYITANSRYKLYINGKYLLSGPCKGYMQSKFCDRIDLGNYLAVGENTIVIKVVSFPPFSQIRKQEKGPDWSMNQPCGAQLFVYGEAKIDDTPYSVSTGLTEWSCVSSAEMSPRYDEISSWLGYMEVVHSAEIPDVYSPNCQWAKAQKSWEVKNDPYGIIAPFELLERPIPLLYHEEYQFQKCIQIQEDDFLEPVAFDQLKEARIPPNCTAVFELDAGELTTGFFRIKFDKGNNAKIKIIYSESYYQIIEGTRLNPIKTQKLVRDDSEHGILMGHYDLVYLSGGFCEYEPFLFRTFRFVRVEIETKDQALSVFQPTYVKTGYPLKVSTQLYDDNEPWVRALWDISLRTLKCCMHETYEDCPYYEQMQYTMDTRLQILFTYAVSLDTQLPQKTLFDYHSSLLPNGMLQARFPCETTQIITPFALDYIFMIYDYYLQTGDKAVIERYRPTIEAILGYYDRHENQNGLIEKLGYWEFVDWVPQWEKNHGVPEACNDGISSIQNFKYAYALMIVSILFQSIHLMDLAQHYESKYHRIHSTLLETCFNHEKGLFQESYNQEDYSEHAQVWAVLSQIKDNEFQRKLLKTMQKSSNLYRCTFPQLFYLFRAYEQTGMYQETQNLWEYWKKLIALHLTTIPEIPENPRSDCHAWGALMLYEYPKKILGVQFDMENRIITVEPKALFIKKAHGKVATPLGEITVKYKIHQGVFYLEVMSENPGKTVVILPDGTRYTMRAECGNLFSGNCRCE